MMYEIAYIFSAVGIASIGASVLYAKRKGIYFWFALVALSISMWLIAQLLVEREQGLRLWLGTSFLLSELIVAFFTYFMYLYPSGNRLPSVIRWLGFLPLIIFAPFSFSELMYEGTDANGSIGLGPLYATQTITVISYLVVGVGSLMLRMRKYKLAERTQAKLLLFAFFVPIVIIGLTGTLFVENSFAATLRPVSVLFTVAVIAYGMIFHGLFDFRWLFARAAGYLVSLGTLAMVYGFIVVILGKIIFDVHLTALAQITLVATMGIVGLSFEKFRKYFDKQTNKLFYRDGYDPQDFIKQLNGAIVGTVSVDTIIDRAMHIIQVNLRTDRCYFWLSATTLEPYRSWSSDGIALRLNDQNVIDLMPSTKRVIMRDDRYMEANKLLGAFMDKNGIDMIMPLAASRAGQENVLGLMLLGPKKSGSPYNAQDKAIVSIIANELVIAIQNAMHFEEIERFNDTLEQKVKTATKKLQKTNEKLVQLDANKDEFISMASHQLRTPLTSMKGYVSMVLEEDAGPLNKQQKQMLGQAFVSSQRMAFLIADLLNISRLRTGKFVIERSQVNLPTLIKEEVDQLRDTAVARGLQLRFEKPQDFPILMLDEMKIRQVIMNFIDNAIYYTRSGGSITVHLMQTDKSIEFRVIDTGIGVPRHEQQHLFTKYFRAGNARQARPDGTGLGLFMAQKVVVAQGGAISFRSTEGKGSTFGFIFPKTKVLLQEIPTESHPPTTPSVYEKVTVVK